MDGEMTTAQDDEFLSKNLCLKLIFRGQTALSTTPDVEELNSLKPRLRSS